VVSLLLTVADINSHFGIMDMCFPQDRLLLLSILVDDKDVLHIAPHWNWKGKEGQPYRMVNTNADNVELLLNGKPGKEGYAPQRSPGMDRKLCAR